MITTRNEIRDRTCKKFNLCKSDCPECDRMYRSALFGFELACEMLEDHCPDVVQSTKNMAAWLREKLK